MKVGKHNMEATDYDQQGTDFLNRHGIKFRATLSDTKPAPWEGEAAEWRHHYRVTLSRKGPAWKPSRVRCVFDFWGSMADAEKGIHPTAYDVLACISGDVQCPSTFSEFCVEYGYEEDSIKSLQTFRRASAFAKRLREFFTEAEITELSKIQ